MLGLMQVERKRYEEGETLLSSAYATQVAALGERHPITLVSARRLVKLYEAWGKPDKAKMWRVRVELGSTSAGS
jgi:Tetratricopeptide repeat